MFCRVLDLSMPGHQGGFFRFLRKPSKFYGIVLRQTRFYSGGAIPSLPPGWTPSAINEANDWVTNFKRKKTLDKQAVTISFARSSGPGGQHVNKVNSKAVIKLSIDSETIPQWAKDRLRTSPAFVASSSMLQTSSTTSRSQSENVDECLKKLHTLILNAAQESIPVIPSKEQQAKVKELKKKENAKRRDEKTKRQQVKVGRKTKWDD